MPTPKTFDICIVGAGPAGSTAAYLLARQGRSVALVDRARFPRDKTCGDGITPRGARVLKRIDALDVVSSKGYACRGVDVRGADPDGRAVEFTIRFDREVDGEPGDLIVLPRFALDTLLLQNAMNAGMNAATTAATYAAPTLFEATKVVDVETRETHARVITDSDLAIDAAMVVLATGAESQLLRGCGLLAGKPPLEHAARAYFENVEGLSDRVVLFFDGVDLPGYGWIFPTSLTSANIGCGVFAQGLAANGAARPRPMPQAQRLEQLIATHPLLVRMLAHATRSGPVRAYPLRTDFRREFAGRGRLLVLGEAAGLVNPITGEGIDYALESAEFAAAAIAARWPDQHSFANSAARCVIDTARAAHIAEDYRARLSKRFTRRFAIYRAAQRFALTPARIPSLLTQVSRTPALQRLVIDGLFGRAKPAHLLRPSTLWHIARLMSGRP